MSATLPRFRPVALLPRPLSSPPPHLPSCQFVNLLICPLALSHITVDLPAPSPRRRWSPAHRADCWKLHPSLRSRVLGRRVWICRRGYSYLRSVISQAINICSKLFQATVRKEGAEQELTDTNKPPPVLAPESFVCRLADGICPSCISIIEMGMLGP
jgi:hypothetical protein